MASDYTTMGQSCKHTSWIWENFVFSAPEEDNGKFADFHKEGKWLVYSFRVLAAYIRLQLIVCIGHA